MEISSGDSLNFFSRHFLQLFQHAVDAFVRQTDGFGLSDFHRLTKHRVQFVNLSGQQLRLGTLELGSADPFLLDAADFVPQCDFEIAHGLSFRRTAVQVEHARAAGRAVVIDAGRNGNLVFAHQLLVETGSVVAIENGRQHLKRKYVVIFLHIAQHGSLVRHDQHGKLGRRLDIDATYAFLGRFVLYPAGRQGASFERPVVLFGQREDLFVVDVTRDHHVGVVRDVPSVVPGFEVCGAHALQVVHPADDRPAIGVRLKGGSVHLLEELGRRFVVGAHAALFHDDLDFLRKLGWINIQVTHAVGLKLHHFFQFFLGHLLEVSRVIATGEGIVTATSCGDAPVELTGANRGGSFEHHVLKRMCDS